MMRNFFFWLRCFRYNVVSLLIRRITTDYNGENDYKKKIFHDLSFNKKNDYILDLTNLETLCLPNFVL